MDDQSSESLLVLSRQLSHYQQLSKTHKGVLQHLAECSNPERVADISHRKLATAVGCTLPTEQAAIRELNRRQLIKTEVRSGTLPSRHTLLTLVCTSTDLVNLLVKTLPQGYCTKIWSLAVENFPASVQILEAFPQAIYRTARASETENSLSLYERGGEETGNNGGKPENLYTSGGPAGGAEIVQFAAAVLGAEPDARLAAGFRHLAEEFPQIPVARLCDYVAWKCGQTEDHPRFSAGGLLGMVRADLARWWTPKRQALQQRAEAGEEILHWFRQKKPAGHTVYRSERSLARAAYA